jgi:hypothetical protein
VAEADLRRRPARPTGRHLDVRHAAPEDRAGRLGLRGKNAAHGGMAHAQHAGHLRHEVGEPQGERQGLLARQVLVVRHGQIREHAAGADQGVVQPEAAKLDDAPRRQALAAHAIDRLEVLLQDRDLDIAARENGGQRAAGDAAAYDHDVWCGAHGFGRLPPHFADSRSTRSRFSAVTSLLTMPRTLARNARVARCNT